MKIGSKGLSLVLTGLLLAGSIPPVQTDAAGPKNEKISALVQKVKSRALLQSQNRTLYIDPTINLQSDHLIQVIVELKTDPVAVQKVKEKKNFDQTKAKQKVKASHDKIKQEAKKKNLHMKVKATYDTVFNGISMEMKESELAKLVESEDIIGVYKNNKIDPIPVEKETGTKPLPTDPNVFLGVDQLWAEGYTGKGLKVGVIDTGIDYKHPDLKTAYKGGYDFVDEDPDPYEGNTEVDSTHGTHVSGIIAGRGNTKKGGMKGVAPNADLYVYRVLGPEGGYDEWVISGIEKAVNDGMDVINLSLGAPVNDSDTATSRAVNNAMLANVITVIAGGNNGKDRHLGTLTSPATASLPISVGATFPPQNGFQFDAQSTIVKNKAYKLNWMMDFEPPALKDLYRDTELVYAGLGTPEEFKKVDVKGKIVLVKRGVMIFDDINRIAAAAGAKAVIMFNNDGYNEHINRPFPASGTLPMFDMRGDDGREMVDALQSATATKKNSVFKLTNMIPDSYPGDDIADFSSNGPVKDTWNIKPDIVAPGVSIYSTVPSFTGDYSQAYDRYSGTSMATPIVAGLSLLMKQAHPNYDVFDVKTALMNTSKELGNNIFGGALYSVLETGAGRVQPGKAMSTPVIAEVLEEALYTKEPLGESNPTTTKYQTGSLNFGDIYDELDKTKTIKLKNKSKTVVTYKLSSEMRRYTVDNPSGEILTGGSGQPEIIFEKEEVTIPANGEVEMEVTLNSKGSAAEARYEGFVFLTPANTAAPTLQLPFAAFKNAKIFSGISNYYLTPKVISPNGDGVKDGTEITYNFSSDMVNATLLIYNEDTNEVGLIKELDENDRKMGDHSFTWNGKYTPVDSEDNLGKEITVTTGIYGVVLLTTDKYGNDTFGDLTMVVSNEKTDIVVNDSNDNNIYTADNKISGVVRSKIVGLSRGFYSNDFDFARIVQLRYEVKQNNKVIDASYMTVLNTSETTKDDEMDFVLEGLLPPGKSTITLTVFDKAGNENSVTYNAHYDKGISIDAKDAELGKELKVTLQANQVENYRLGEFRLDYNSSSFSFAKAEVHPEFLKVHPNAVVATEGNGKNLQVRVDGKDTAAGLNGNVPVVNLYFNTSADVKHLGEKIFTVSEASYNDGQSLKGSEKSIEVYATPVKITGKLQLEAYFDKTGKPRTDIDYVISGNMIRVFDSETHQELLIENGYRVEMERVFNHDGTFEVKGLKPGEVYDVEVFVPGHLNAVFKNVSTSHDQNGIIVPTPLTALTPVLQKAGDANGDNKIDYYDRILVNRFLQDKAVYGYFQEWMANGADINKDGIINDVDLNYTKKNEGLSGDIKEQWIGETEAKLKLEADQTSLKTGDIVAVKAVISNASGLYGLQSLMGYDPKVLQPVNKDGSPITTSAGTPGDFFTDAIAPVDYIKNGIKNNEVEFAASYKGDTKQELKAEGTVVTYYFKWINPDAAATVLKPFLKTVDSYGYLYQGKAVSLDLTRN